MSQKGFLLFIFSLIVLAILHTFPTIHAFGITSTYYNINGGVQSERKVMYGWPTCFLLSDAKISKKGLGIFDLPFSKHETSMFSKTGLIFNIASFLVLSMLSFVVLRMIFARRFTLKQCFLLVFIASAVTLMALHSQKFGIRKFEPGHYQISDYERVFQ